METRHPVRAEEELLASIASGDRAALGELYDRLAGPAYGLALRVLRDPALAEDAVQDAFLSVWRASQRYSARQGSARAWVLMLVHRRAVDLVRRENRRSAGPLDELTLVGAEDASPDGVERARVRAALAAFPERERQALALAYFGGLTQREVSARLGIPLGTVKTRTFAGLARLRDALAEPSRSAAAA